MYKMNFVFNLLNVLNVVKQINYPSLFILNEKLSKNERERNRHWLSLIFQVLY